MGTITCANLLYKYVIIYTEIKIRIFEFDDGSD